MTASDIHDAISERLRATDHRYTTARRRLVEVLAANGGPMTLPELLDADRTLAQPSAHRNLAVLEQAGAVTRIVTSGDHASYELAEDPWQPQPPRPRPRPRRTLPDMPVTSRLRIERLDVSYGGRLALAGVDLDVPPATTVAVIGPNGSGKSTLLGAVAGLLAPAAGRIVVDRSSLALVLQSTDVDPGLPVTVLETVRMARYAHRGMFRRLRDDDREAVRAAMALTAVEDLAHRQLHELSGGQRQRVLVAQGLAQGADLLLLDEPVTGLDIVSREVILDVVAEERAAGRTVVMTTHSLEDAAACDVVVLLAGRMVAVGPPTEVLTDDHLRAAFGGKTLRLADGQVLLDDPHHHAGT